MSLSSAAGCSAPPLNSPQINSGSINSIITVISLTRGIKGIISSISVKIKFYGFFHGKMSMSLGVPNFDEARAGLFLIWNKMVCSKKTSPHIGERSLVSGLKRLMSG